MPKREIGLMGYIGEAVVKQWLEVKHPKEQFKIIEQIIPENVPAKGGGYLDFGVYNKIEEVIEAIYEVKSQDYIQGKDFTINNALIYLWENKGKRLKFKNKDGIPYKGNSKIKVKLVMLVGANESGRKIIKKENLKNVILFKDIWKKLNDKINIEDLDEQIKEDTQKVIEILITPTQGKKITPEFIKARNNS